MRNRFTMWFTDPLSIPFWKGNREICSVSQERQRVGKGELFAQLLIQQLGRNHDTSSFIQLRLSLLERHYESREVSSRWLIRRLFKRYNCQYPVNCIKDFQCSMTSRIKSVVLLLRRTHFGTHMRILPWTSVVPYAILCSLILHIYFYMNRTWSLLKAVRIRRSLLFPVLAHPCLFTATFLAAVS